MRKTYPPDKIISLPSRKKKPLTNALNINVITLQESKETSFLYLGNLPFIQIKI
jgi:hypothetical protein